MEYSAGKADEFVDGDRKVVVCGEFEIGIFRFDGQFFAWHNSCAHRGGPVCQGRVMKRVLETVDSNQCVGAQSYDDGHLHIVCPWHGYEYDIRTGVNPANDRIRLRKADVVVRDGEIYVRP